MFNRVQFTNGKNQQARMPTSFGNFYAASRPGGFGNGSGYGFGNRPASSFNANTVNSQFRYQQFGNYAQPEMDQQFNGGYGQFNSVQVNPIATPTFEDVTHHRMLMKKKYYINNSNTKWLTVGIKPASKFLGPDAAGFYVDTMIGGGKMKPVSLGGIDGFINLCKTLRENFDEFKYAYSSSSNNYANMSSLPPINIIKAPIGGNLCFQIELPTGTAFIAMSSVMEILKNEKLFSAAAKSEYAFLLTSCMLELFQCGNVFMIFIILIFHFFPLAMSLLAADCEKKFNDFVVKGATDMAALYIEAEESNNLLLSEVLINFGELFKMCVEAKALQSNSIERPIVEAPAAKQTQQRRRRAKNDGKEVPAKKCALAKVGSTAARGKQQSNAKVVTATINPDQPSVDYTEDLIEELDEELDDDDE